MGSRLLISLSVVPHAIIRRKTGRVKIVVSRVEGVDQCIGGGRSPSQQGQLERCRKEGQELDCERNTGRGFLEAVHEEEIAGHFHLVSRPRGRTYDQRALVVLGRKRGRLHSASVFRLRAELGFFACALCMAGGCGFLFHIWWLINTHGVHGVHVFPKLS